MMSLHEIGTTSRCREVIRNVNYCVVWPFSVLTTIDRLWLRQCTNIRLQPSQQPVQLHAQTIT
jgi:hypothetical protein